MIPRGAVIADVGTDHALLPAWLVARGLAPRAIASDRAPGPLRAARRSLDALGVGARVELRCGEGLAVLAEGEAEVIVIAGMGGRKIAAIVDARRSLAAAHRRLVVQPLAHADEVRRWLCGAGWALVDEALCEERGEVRVVIAAEPARSPVEPLGALDAALGPVLRRRGGELFARMVGAMAGHAEAALRSAHEAGERRRLDALAERAALLGGELARVGGAGGRDVIKVEG